MSTDYAIGALDVLLEKDCLCERYYPLIKYKSALISGLALLGCRTKSDAEKLSDDELMQSGISIDEVRLFRKFLTIYDAKPAKFREIEKLCASPEEQAAFRELYCLPGVKYVRANLYYRAGYKSLSDIASASEREILERTAAAIAENSLGCIVPLPKEVRTHIAVSKAFLWE